MSSNNNQVLIAIIGLGGVGKCFLSQLAHLSTKHPSPKLQLCFLSTSKKALYNPDYTPIPYGTALASVSSTSTAPPSLASVAEYLSGAPGKVILVDNTSSQEVAESYALFLRRGISIVTPNKKAFSGSHALWKDIFAAASESPAAGRIYHESSVGAGLPVISTLRDLVDTGDEIVRIEGVFSGTMSFLFNSFAPVDSPSSGGATPTPTTTTTTTATTWSAEVRKAKELGYTEPDPRDDLNGLDVARKLTILARLAGLAVESPTSFPVESLIPKDLETAASGDEFLARLPEFDAHMDAVKANAEKQGKVVRYIGSIDVGSQTIKVGMETFDKGHAIAGLRGSDNIISFYTKRYGSQPLIVQGAGAGGDVTAMGVTADLLKVLGQI